MKSFFITGLILISIVLIGCSGGGGEEAANPEDTPPSLYSGTFVDDVVVDLNYSCSSGKSALTDTEGHFTCPTGDDVQFFLGTLALGTHVVQSERVTPYSLFPISTNIGAAINLARLLQALDSDGGANNGLLTLDVNVTAQLPANLDFTSGSFDTDLGAFLSSNGLTLPTKEIAMHRLNNNIENAGGAIPTGAHFPEAKAGSDQSLHVGDTVHLDGSNSSDVDGDTLIYSWSIITLPASSSATLTNATSVTPTFVADVNGSYVVQLVVNDGLVSSYADNLLIVASNQNAVPVANAGVDQNVVTTNSVTLDGSGSTDADLDSLSYSWSITSKPTSSIANLSSATSDHPTFVADLDGTYTVQLIVNDGTVNSAPATVNIVASSGNTQPVAHAGKDQNVDTNTLVLLSGQGTDADFDSLTYLWSLTSLPSGSSAILVDETTKTPTFTADKDGPYVIQLVVNDGTVDSNPDSVLVQAATPTGSGALDTTFGTSGVAVFNEISTTDGWDVVVDSSGNIYVTGYETNISTYTNNMKLWKYRNNGTLDATFADNGVATYVGGYGRSIALDAAGDIFVAGYDKIWKYTSAGIPDTAFGTNGITSYSGAYYLDMLIDKNGKFFVTGSLSSKFAVWKYDANGSLDTSFGTDGIVNMDVIESGKYSSGIGISLDDSGNIFVSGQSDSSSNKFDIFVVKLSSLGTLDTSFGTNGIVTHDGGAGRTGKVDLANDMTLDNAGNIFVVGRSEAYVGYSITIYKFDENGSLDTSFNGDGIVVPNAPAGNTFGIDNGFDIVLNDKGDIFVVGKANTPTDDYDMVLLKYSSNGTLDTSFSDDGIVTHNSAAGGNYYDGGHGVTLDATGDIFVVGGSWRSTGREDHDMVIWKYKK